MLPLSFELDPGPCSLYLVLQLLSRTSCASPSVLSLLSATLTALAEDIPALVPHSVAEIVKRLTESNVVSTDISKAVGEHLLLNSSSWLQEDHMQSLTELVRAMSYWSAQYSKAFEVVSLWYVTQRIPECSCSLFMLLAVGLGDSQPTSPLFLTLLQEGTKTNKLRASMTDSRQDSHLTDLNQLLSTIVTNLEVAEDDQDTVIDRWTEATFKRFFSLTFQSWLSSKQAAAWAQGQQPASHGPVDGKLSKSETLKPSMTSAAEPDRGEQRLNVTMSVSSWQHRKKTDAQQAVTKPVEADPEPANESFAQRIEAVVKPFPLWDRLQSLASWRFGGSAHKGFSSTISAETSECSDEQMEGAAADITESSGNTAHVDDAAVSDNGEGLESTTTDHTPSGTPNSVPSETDAPVVTAPAPPAASASTMASNGADPDKDAWLSDLLVNIDELDNEEDSQDLTASSSASNAVADDHLAELLRSPGIGKDETLVADTGYSSSSDSAERNDIDDGYSQLEAVLFGTVQPPKESTLSDGRASSPARTSEPREENWSQLSFTDDSSVPVPYGSSPSRQFAEKLSASEEPSTSLSASQYFRDGSGKELPKKAILSTSMGQLKWPYAVYQAADPNATVLPYTPSLTQATQAFQVRLCTLYEE